MLLANQGAPCSPGVPLPMALAAGAPQRTSLSGAIWAAAERGDAPAVEALLDAEGYSGPDCRSVNQSTLLHCAAKLGHLQLAAALLARGADVNALDYGGMRRTPLHWVRTGAAANPGLVACHPCPPGRLLVSTLHLVAPRGLLTLCEECATHTPGAVSGPRPACAGLQGRPRGDGGAPGCRGRRHKGVARMPRLVVHSSCLPFCLSSRCHRSLVSAAVASLCCHAGIGQLRRLWWLPQLIPPAVGGAACACR